MSWCLQAIGIDGLMALVHRMMFGPVKRDSQTAHIVECRSSILGITL